MLQSHSSLPTLLLLNLFIVILSAPRNSNAACPHVQNYIIELDYMLTVAAIQFIVTFPPLIVDFLRTSQEDEEQGNRLQ